MRIHMAEKYELPVLFTEEERREYAAWGMKKEKTLLPFAIATILIYIAAAVLIVIKVWGVRETDHIWFQILVQSAWIPELTGGLAIVMTICLLGPLNLLLDRLWKKPGEPMRLWVEPVGTEVKIGQSKNGNSAAEIMIESHELSELPQFLHPEENSIFYGGNWLKIGANTIANIYPLQKQHAWMDHPENKAKDITEVRRLQEILEGYEKSLEAARKEQEWVQEHGNAENHADG